MLQIPKEYKLDEILVKIKLYVQGIKRQIVVNTTASEACRIIDLINHNYYQDDMTEEEIQETLEKRYIILNDVKGKHTVMIRLDDIKYMEIPFLVDTGDNYTLEILDNDKVKEV